MARSPRTHRRSSSRLWWLHHTARRVGSGVRDRTAGWHQSYLSRTTLYTRTVLWVTVAVCAALVLFTASETWVNLRLRQQVSQVKLENQRLRLDATATDRKAAWAESPATIEDEARSIGYARPGDQPVVIATRPSQPSAAPAPSTAPGATRVIPGGHWLDWWRMFFGG